MGTREGANRAHQTMIQKLGAVGYRQHMAAIGAKGGKAQVKKGFAVTRKPPEEPLIEGAVTE